MNIKRSLKYGTNSAVLIIFVVAIAVILNMLVSRFDYKIDLTPYKIFSISKESMQIINNIPKETPVKIYSFSSDVTSEYEEIMKKYVAAGKGKVDVEYKDPVKNPEIFEDLKLEDVGEGVLYVVQSGTRKKALYEDDIYTYEYDDQGKRTNSLLNIEQAITGSIKYVTAKETPTVYFTTGNSEILPSKAFNNFGDILDDNNFEMDTIDLSPVGKVPNDCKILIVGSPKYDLGEDEKNLINKYLSKGGSAMFLFDGAESNVKYTNIQKILDDYNIEIKNDMVGETDSDRRLPSDKYAFLADFTSAGVNRVLVEQNIPMMLFRARSFRIRANQEENLTTTSLLKTQATGESNDIATGTTQKGAQDLAIGAQKTFNQITSKVIVVGDTDYLMDETMSNMGQSAMVNVYSLVSWMNWLHEMENDTIVAPKQMMNTTFRNITESNARTIVILTFIVLPLLVLLAGVFVFIRRRHL